MENTAFTSNLKREEIWKPIKNYEGLYEISNFGNVRSIDRVVICKDERKLPIKGKNCKARFSNLDEALAYRNRKIGEIEKQYREKENEFIQ